MEKNGMKVYIRTYIPSLVVFEFST